MNPFRKSREFSLYRQMVFGDRAGAPDQANPLWTRVFNARGAAPPPVPQAGVEGDAPAQTDAEIE